MTISRRVGGVMLATLTMICAASALQAGILPIFQKIDCANGYNEAFVVIVIDPSYGCVLSVYGRDCSGVIWHEWNRDRIVPDPPLLPFTHHFEGISDDGTPWFVNANIEDGNLIGLWGRKSNGDYFVSELADLL